LQSVSHIIGEGIGRVSFELRKILSNKRQNQSSYSVSNVPTSYLLCIYLRDCLGLAVVQLSTTTTSHVSRSSDMSITHVRNHIIYFAMRVETMQSLSAAISVFGITAAVGIRKKLAEARS
jgi:hypothetical protein